MRSTFRPRSDLMCGARLAMSDLLHVHPATSMRRRTTGFIALQQTQLFCRSRLKSATAPISPRHTHAVLWNGFCLQRVFLGLGFRVKHSLAGMDVAVCRSHTHGEGRERDAGMGPRVITAT
eukprot:349912-Chlamydomonas_euryale.AAC.17